MHSSLVNEREGAANPCKLIVNYLPQSLKEEQFKALFSQIGEMKSCKLVFDKQTGKTADDFVCHWENIVFVLTMLRV